MKIAIYYFSGTGNTAFIAETMKSVILAMNEEKSFDHKVELVDTSISNEYKSDADLLVIGGPIYAGNMPQKLITWVKKNIPQNNGKTKAIVYSTSTGLLNAYGVDTIASKLKKKGYDVLLKKAFEMPRNFYFDFGQFEAHTEEEIKERIEAAKNDTEKLTHNIINEFLTSMGTIEVEHKGVFVKDVFARVFSIMAKSMGKNFTVDESCVSCGKCVESCPQDNIIMTEGVISYKKSCMMCTRCIHICPQGSISYKGKKYPQYQEFLK